MALEFDAGLKNSDDVDFYDRVSAQIGMDMRGTLFDRGAVCDLQTMSEGFRDALEGFVYVLNEPPPVHNELSMKAQIAVIDCLVSVYADAYDHNDPEAMKAVEDFLVGAAQGKYGGANILIQKEISEFSYDLLTQVGLKDTSLADAMYAFCQEEPIFEVLWEEHMKGGTYYSYPDNTAAETYDDFGVAKTDRKRPRYHGGGGKPNLVP